MREIEPDIRPRFEEWARARWTSPGMVTTLTAKNGEPFYTDERVQCAWLAWREASEGERARVAACLI